LPEVRPVLLAALLVWSSAQAQLYRWVDPQTGSVKYSTSPPEGEGVRAEVVPYKPPPAAPAPAQPAPSASALEARWSELLRTLSALTPQDFSRPSAGVMKQVEDFGTLTGELDRLDPAGTPRRRAQAESMLERLSKGLAAQAAAQRK